MDIKHLKSIGYKEATTPSGQKFLVQDFGENRQTLGSRFEYRVDLGFMDLCGSSPTMDDVYIDIQKFTKEFGVA